MANIQEAAKHIAALDPNANAVTIQTFDDNKDRKDRSLCHVLHGSLDSLADRLTDLNNRGAAICVTVNETDFQGRAAKNIVRVRAFWIEDDNNSNIPLPLLPSFVIESSPNKFHRYFLVDGIGVDEFDPIQRRMITDYGSDPDARDVSRVLRLAGFAHQKVNKQKGLTGKPFIVRMV